MHQPNFTDYNSRVQRNKRRNILKKIVCVLSCVVVFCTTYALILPAITMEGKVFCGMEEHAHTEDCYKQVRLQQLVCTPENLNIHSHGSECYDDNGALICGKADFVAHTHDASCYDENDHLICMLPEHVAHVHQESCYVPAETEPPVLHSHIDTCYHREKGDLLCDIPETEAHTHEETCYVSGEELLCSIEEGHIHSDDCYTQDLICTELDDHTHSQECYGEPQLNCLIPENHAHEDSCYNKILCCELAENSGHTHNDDCFAWSESLICNLEEGQPEPTEAKDPVLICKEPIAEVHVHDASCFVEMEPKYIMICTDLSEDHVHIAQCYELDCSKTVHTHTASCHSDPNADVETPDVWEATFAEVELTGKWPEDVLAIAQTQLGYHESTRNYAVWEDESLHGYTRYGDWYGYPHGDWCAMFVSFCLHYADVKDMPLDCEVNSWIKNLTEEKLYHTPENYTPKPGDLIFFDWQNNDSADHVGLVAEIIPETEYEPVKIKTLEGNSSNSVEYVYYDLDSPVIFGYSELPENAELYDCGISGHAHNEYCYGDDEELLCDLIEHIHEDTCLVVSEEIPSEPTSPAEDVTEPTESVEVYLCNKEEHVHDQNCFSAEDQLVCSLEEHTHDDTCLTGNPTEDPTEDPTEPPEEPASDPTEPYNCELEEHIHEEFCYDASGNLICTLTEHVHDDTCLPKISDSEPEVPTVYYCGRDAHSHAFGCYSDSLELICPVEAHTHNESCVQAPEYICGVEAHTHNENCYGADGSLTCKQLVHEHNAACEGYTCGMETHFHGIACYNEEGTLICRTLEHEHSSVCNQYTCGKTVHIHGYWCYDAGDRIVCGFEQHSHNADCICYTLSYVDSDIRVTADITGVEVLPDFIELRVTPITMGNAPDQFTSMESAVNDQLANNNQYAGSVNFYDLKLFVNGTEYMLPKSALVNVTVEFISPVFNQNSADCQAFMLTTENALEETVQDEPEESGFIETVGETVNGLFSKLVLTAEATEVGAENDQKYQASPINDSDYSNSDEGITTVTFQTNQLSAIGVVLAADESTEPVTNQYWKRVNSLNDIESGKNYMIISSDGNYALSSGSTNYHPVQIHAVKGNETYFTITNDVNSNLIWTITGNNGTYTISNNNRYLVPGSNTVVTTSSNTVTVSTENYSADGGPYWLFSRKTGFRTYKLYNDGGQFSSSTSVSNETLNMLIFKQVDVTLSIPSDPKGSEISSNTPAGSAPDSNLYLPFTNPGDKKIGVDGTSVTDGVATVTGSYYSDIPTSDIEREFRVQPEATDNTAEAKQAAALAAYAAHQLNDGKVLTDKSVIYGDDAYGAFDSYAPNTFGVTLSTLAQAYQQSEQDIIPIPVDVVYVLDVSGSMQDNDRAVNLVDAVNKSMKQIMDSHEANRVGIALYSSGAMQLLPLDRYTADNNTYIKVEKSGGEVTGGILTTASLRNSAGSNAYANKGENGFDGLGTFTQAGIASGYEIFKKVPQGVVNNTGTQYTATMPSGNSYTIKRQPVLVLVSDGEPTHCTNIYNDPLNGPFYGDGTSAVENYTQSGYSYTRNALGVMGYYTVLSANYFKRMTAIHYDTPALFYTIGMGIAESGKGNRVSTHAEYDGYKRAVLNPAVINDQDTADSVAFASVTLDLMKNLLAESFTGSQIGQSTSDYITVNRNNNACGTWVNHLNADVPVLKANPYKNNFNYADLAFFGEMDPEKLKEVFDKILTSSTKSNRYGFILYESLSSVYFTDNIGDGMEIKGLENNADGTTNSLAPKLQYGNIQYAPKSVVSSGNLTTITYEGIYDDPLIPDRTIDLSEVEVTITSSADGKQTIYFFIPDTALPVYIPDDTESFYYEALPVRLIYQVGLTADAEQAVLALRNTGGSLTFYTNSWDSGEVANSILLPHIQNPYYFEFIEGEDGEVDRIYRADLNHHEHKSENITGTHPDAVSCTIEEYDATVRNTHLLGNNGKLVFTVDTIEIPVTKVWAEGTPEGAKTPVEVTLYKVTPATEGENIGTGQVVETVMITADTQWMHSFTNLEKPDGNWYYAIGETITDGFEATYSGGDLITFTITDLSGTTEIQAVKVIITEGESGSTTNPITVTNEYRMYELPKTGGIGTTTIYVLGILLILCCGVYLVYDKKRKVYTQF